MFDLIKIGKILAPFGIKGEVKIYSEVKNLKLFQNICIKKDETKIFINSLKLHKNDLWIAKIDNITSRNEAENVKNTEIYAKNQDFPRKNGEIYDFETIGFEVFEENNLNFCIGKIDHFIYLKNDKIIAVKVVPKFNKGCIDKGILLINRVQILNVLDKKIIIKPILESLKW